MREASGKPVQVENDVFAAALGELAYGGGKGLNSFLFLTYGTGIGGAYVKEGSCTGGSGPWPATGAIFSPIRTAGRVPAGRRAAMRHMPPPRPWSGRWKGKPARPMTGRLLFQEAKENPCIRECLDAWIDEVVRGLVTLVNTLDPEAVLLGGGIMREAALVEEIRRRLPSRLSPVSRSLPVASTRLGNTAGMLGAVYLCRRLLQRTRGLEGG